MATTRLDNERLRADLLRLERRLKMRWRLRFESVRTRIVSRCSGDPAVAGPDSTDNTFVMVLRSLAASA